MKISVSLRSLNKPRQNFGKKRTNTLNTMNQKRYSFFFSNIIVLTLCVEASSWDSRERNARSRRLAFLRVRVPPFMSRCPVPCFTFLSRVRQVRQKRNGNPRRRDPVMPAGDGCNFRSAFARDLIAPWRPFAYRELSPTLSLTRFANFHSASLDEVRDYRRRPQYVWKYSCERGKV